MIENLVIVESPAKAKTIERFLGKDYTVKSSFGHIRDLEKKDLGIDIKNNFQPQYEVSADKKAVVKELKSLAKEAKTVWLASDEDREGEAIAWHLFEVLNLKPENTKRIVFHEITKDAILNAIKNQRNIDRNLVNAQQARRVLDRLVGFEVSPVLWKKVKPSLSAGRVQSVAVKLIVEREREINAFQEQQYYKVTGNFETLQNKTGFKAEAEERFKDKAATLAYLETCKNGIFTVNDVEKKPVLRKPAPPFTTSTLQQEASRKLGFSVSQTMSVAVATRKYMLCLSLVTLQWAISLPGDLQVLSWATDCSIWSPVSSVNISDSASHCSQGPLMSIFMFLVGVGIGDVPRYLRISSTICM